MKHTTTSRYLAQRARGLRRQGEALKKTAAKLESAGNVLIRQSASMKREATKLQEQKYGTK